MTVLEERGLFWWHHEEIPAKQFAPNSNVSGLLKIDKDGLITLELDGYLSTERSPMSVMLHGEHAKLAGKRIEGILKVTGKRVLLIELRKHGGRFSTGGMSYEGYAATHCLIGHQAPPRANRPLTSKEMDIELTGLEEWLRLGSIKGTRTRSKILAVYKNEKDIRYIVHDGDVTIRYHIDGPYRGAYRTDDLKLKQVVSLVYRPQKALTIDELATKFRLTQELFILLTNSEYAVEWPSIKIRSGGENRTYRLYFWRLKTPDKPPSYFECPTSFPQLQNIFGDIVSEWQKKREQFGPGFYLYLGVRRGVKLYTEHRFVNLVWGLEALHRRKPLAASSNEPRVKAKVQRILDQISLSKDKKWLAERLKFAHEPSLEDRIFDVITTVPISLEPKRLRAFAKICADLRNDISHFGSQRRGESYEQFLEKLTKASEALSVVYHMLILHEIGVDKKMLNSWVYDGFRSYPNKSHLVAVGLLDPSVLKPPALPDAGGAVA